MQYTFEMTACLEKITVRARFFGRATGVNTSRDYKKKENSPRDGNLCVLVIVKSCVNKYAGSWLAAQEWATNLKPGQQVDLTLDMTTTHKFPPQNIPTALSGGKEF